MPLYEPILPARYADILVNTAQDLDPAIVRPLLRAVGLTRRNLKSPSAVLGISQFDDLVEVATSLLGRDDLGFEFGMRLNLDDHAALSLALRRCRTGDELLGMLGRYWRLTTTCFLIQYRRSSGVGEVIFRPVASMKPLTLHVMEEMFAVSFHRDYMAMAGTRSGLTMHLSRPRPSHEARYRSLLPTLFNFGREPLPQARCVISQALLDGPLQHTAQAIAQTGEKMALTENDPARTRQCANYVQLILQEAEGVQPSAHAIARWLNVSPRTLIRHLGAEGYTLREMGVAIRYRRARQMLGQSRQPIGQIAQRLGYASVIGFSNAFKQCAGIGPRAYRNSVVA